MMNQLHIGAKTEWESQAMSKSSEAKSSINNTCTQGTTAQQYFPKIK